MRSPQSISFNEEERKFLREMIVHHEMAIDMCRRVLTYVNDPDIEGIAYSIMKTQTDEIGLMRQMLN